MQFFFDSAAARLRDLRDLRDLRADFFSSEFRFTIASSPLRCELSESQMTGRRLPFRKPGGKHSPVVCGIVFLMIRLEWCRGKTPFFSILPFVCLHSTFDQKSVHLRTAYVFLQLTAHIFSTRLLRTAYSTQLTAFFLSQFSSLSVDSEFRICNASSD